MKTWPTVAMLALGLSYALYFQLGLRAPHIAQPSAFGAPGATQAASSPKPAPRPAARARRWAFGGYPCQRDCREDWAGYRWAKVNGIADPDDCTGKTGAFIAGCRVYARQQVR